MQCLLNLCRPLNEFICINSIRIYSNDYAPLPVNIFLRLSSVLVILSAFACSCDYYILKIKKG